VLAQPRREPDLGLAVARGCVDVVHAIALDERERAVGVGLRRRPVAQRRRAEDRARALVTGATEGELLDRHA
jgi:hypothetical protein